MSIEPLADQIKREYKKWAFSTKVYGTIYVTVRAFLIIATSIVAAQKNLSESAAQFLANWVPILAVLVTIVTSIDTWMKPRDKWRGFMEDRDDLGDLVIRVDSSQGTDTSLFDTLRNDFKKIRSRHRSKNVY
jgi:hypothetical protein